MKLVKGTYNTAKIFTENVEEGAIKQIKALCDMEAYKDSQIRIMPDVHAGIGATIGTTMTLHGKVTPNLVGVDIGCGMTVASFPNDIDFEKLDAVIHSRIPSGMSVRDTPHPFINNVNLSAIYCFSESSLSYEKCSLGTLGGGNHFIEVDRNDNRQHYLVVHSGSRHLGTLVAKYYQKKAIDSLKGTTSEDVGALIRHLKEQGRQREIQAALETLSKHACPVDEALAYCEGKFFDGYIHDMGIVQNFATWNRRAIIDEIAKGLGVPVTILFETIHNYIDLEAMILRKGSVSAKEGEKLIIPMNMRDGSLICVGRGNPDWNYSAPHGAGRLYSRAEAKRRFNLDEYKQSMEGIYSTSIDMGTIDESPMAYKQMDEIIANIADTVDVTDVIKPVYNFKASENVPVWRK